MNIDMIREYKELSIFLLKTLQGSLSSGHDSGKVLSSLHESLVSAANASQIKRIHKQVKALLIKEKPVDVDRLLASIQQLKNDLLFQSNVENDLHSLVDELKSLLGMALHQIEALSLHKEESRKLFLECRDDLKNIAALSDMKRYVVKFKRLFSICFFKISTCLLASCTCSRDCCTSTTSCRVLTCKPLVCCKSNSRIS